MVKYQESEVLSKKACRIEVMNRNSRERIFGLVVGMMFFVIGLLLNDCILGVVSSVIAALYSHLASIRLDGFKEKGDHVGARPWEPFVYYPGAMATSAAVGSLVAIAFLAIGV